MERDRLGSASDDDYGFFSTSSCHDGLDGKAECAEIKRLRKVVAQLGQT